MFCRVPPFDPCPPCECFFRSPLSRPLGSFATTVDIRAARNSPRFVRLSIVSRAVSCRVTATETRASHTECPGLSLKDGLNSPKSLSMNRPTKTPFKSPVTRCHTTVAPIDPELRGRRNSSWPRPKTVSPGTALSTTFPSSIVYPARARTNVTGAASRGDLDPASARHACVEVLPFERRRIRRNQLDDVGKAIVEIRELDFCAVSREPLFDADFGAARSLGLEIRVAKKER